MMRWIEWYIARQKLMQMLETRYLSQERAWIARAWMKADREQLILIVNQVYELE